MTTKEAAPATYSQGLFLEAFGQIVFNRRRAAKKISFKKIRAHHQEEIGRLECLL
ncbi:hypothetical protein [Bradyrhizobium guangdongense]|uniref:hypothetical protein n=1 Tax=Bradyrhizobium guangdongense TaxID=1325090 RepID=UPI0016425103|nr:hypothetical protein [Bradyrhizobium guangdongense]